MARTKQIAKKNAAQGKLRGKTPRKNLVASEAVGEVRKRRRYRSESK
jgi:hypothetical protein